MQNGRESQYCEFLEFLGRPMNFLGRPINFLGRGSSWVVTHACPAHASGGGGGAPTADSPAATSDLVTLNGKLQGGAACYFIYSLARW
eukprot:COSAG02_NODE_610_length_19566_cov_39.049622_3_plen_88_part_00